MPRLFFGVEIPDDLRSKLSLLQGALQSSGVRAGGWSHSSLFHLTVLFLGQLPESSLAILHGVGTTAGASVTPFRLTLSNLGVFPKNKVLWIGITGDDGATSLARLHDVVHKAAAATKLVPLDDRPFRAHLTLARKLELASLPPELLSSVPKPGVQQAFSVSRLALFESKREAGTLVYTPIDTFPLLAKP